MGTCVVKAVAVTTPRSLGGLRWHWVDFGIADAVEMLPIKFQRLLIEEFVRFSPCQAFDPDRPNSINIARWLGKAHLTLQNKHEGGARDRSYFPIAAMLSLRSQITVWQFLRLLEPYSAAWDVWLLQSADRNNLDRSLGKYHQNNQMPVVVGSSSDCEANILAAAYSLFLMRSAMDRLDYSCSCRGRQSTTCRDLVITTKYIINYDCKFLLASR